MRASFSPGTLFSRHPLFPLGSCGALNTLGTLRAGDTLLSLLTLGPDGPFRASRPLPSAEPGHLFAVYIY